VVAGGGPDRRGRSGRWPDGCERLVKSWEGMRERRRTGPFDRRGPFGSSVIDGGRTRGAIALRLSRGREVGSDRARPVPGETPDPDVGALGAAFDGDP
jgi:hypothetical protein